MWAVPRVTWWVVSGDLGEDHCSELVTAGAAGCSLQCHPAVTQLHTTCIAKLESSM